MKVLWITNVLFPDVCTKLGVEVPVTGGWMKSSAKALLNLNNNIEIAVATLYGNEYKKEIINEITYYCLPFNIYNQKKYNPDIEYYWKLIAKDFNPDIVHIHGTEYPHGLAYIRAMGNDNIVISIQGLVHVIARYSLGLIPINILKKYITIYDLLKGHIWNHPKRMLKKGKIEEEYIKLSRHIIGRTTWDKDHIWAINPTTQYHFCNETLRDPFYQTEWDIRKCEKHSIFLSQAQNPIKGIHKVVEAIPYVIREFPDVKVYIAGSNFIQKKSLKDKLRFRAYANYVLHLMESLQVRDRFIFTGPLNEEEMSKRYRSAHVFICPSSIENSPNSLGEAQLVGTPVIASYAGGIPSMVKDGISGLLYRFEEHEMLASCICRIFENEDLANELSKNERQIASSRHDKLTNAQKTFEIYKKILQNNCTKKR